MNPAQKYGPPPLEKAAGERQGARRPAPRAERSYSNERGRGCDGSTACFSPAACRSRMNGAGRFAGVPRHFKGAPYLGLRFFRRLEGFFQGLWLHMAAWAHRLQTHRICIFAKGQSRCGAPKRFARQGGSACPRVGTAAFRNSFFGRMRRYLSKFAFDGGALRFISRRRRAPFVPSAVVRRFWCAALRRCGARDGGVSMQKHARRQNRRAYTYFPFSARKIRRTRICG